MLAPLQFFRRLRRPLLATVLLVVASLVAAGCTIPGRSHLRPPTKGLAPVFGVLPDDMIGLTLLDPDPTAARWTALDGPLGKGSAAAVVGAWQERVFGDGDAPTGWVGPVVGTAWRTLSGGDDASADPDAATFAFAAVADRGALEDGLHAAGWTRHGAAIAAGSDRHLTAWSAPGSANADLPELALGDHELVAAATGAALRKVLHASTATTIKDRASMAQKVVDAMRRTPMAFVYRTDIARGQLRRRFEGDPAALELSTWATASSVITALRDGWIGVAPPRDSSRHAVHLVGSADWIPALSPDWELHPADRAQLEALPASVTTGVALRNAGGLMTTELQAVARGGQDFATKLDVPKGEHRVEIFPLLDRLDGQAAVGYTVGSHQLDVRVERGGDDDLHSDLGEALDLAGIDASVETDGEDLVVHAPHATALREQVIVTKLGGTPEFTAAMQGAGKPPRPPVLWLWQRGVGCAATSGGWVTYDGGGVLDVSLDVSLAPARTCTAASGAADLATLAMAR